LPVWLSLASAPEEAHDKMWVVRTMSQGRFYFDAIGTRTEVLGQLKKTDVGGLSFAEEIRNAVLHGIEAQADPVQPGFEDRYSINVQGHTGDAEAPLTVSVTVQSRYMPKADQA
jgi:hypothetical protein